MRTPSSGLGRRGLNFSLKIPVALTLAAALGLLFTPPAHAGKMETHDYLDVLIQTAAERNLSNHQYWRLLLHYKKTFWGTYESEEDAPAFFNAPNGKTDSQAEMVATLASFFRPPNDLKPEEEHPQCIFPARYKWLRSELAFDPDRLPEQPCLRLENWLRELNPEKITLVFAAHYLNNPASMFGHTLLRIDKKREGRKPALLDYGVNYAANADTNNPLTYTLKGLFGWFKGTFTVFPYYFKVQEYNNLESRDLWEYELNFTDDQVDYFLRHLWELGGNYFDYYYFQENCSYHILSLLEVADPDLHLSDQFTFHVIPGETVRVVARQPGLISRQVYRPSLLSQMNQKRIRMNATQKKLLSRLIKDPSLTETGEFSAFSLPERALILDAYLDFAQYRTLNRERSVTVIDKDTRKILLERSRLEIPLDDPPNAVHFSTPPELGHGSTSVRMGFGRNEQEFFEEFSIRPAYHDLMAKDTGYGKDSQILFMEVTGRYYDDSKEAKLDRFRLIDIVSLTPYDPLFRKKSWKLSIGTDTLRDIACDYCSSLKLNYGLGLTYEPHFFSPWRIYALADLEAEYSSHLDSRYRAGGGGTAGLLLDPTDRWRIQLQGNYLKFPFGQDSDYHQVSFNQRYALHKDLDFRVELNRIKNRGEWLFTVNYYF